MKLNSIIFLLSVVGALALVWFLIWPKAQDIDELRSIVGKQRDDLAVLRQTEISIRDNVDFYSGLDPEYVQLIELAVPSNPDKVNITNILDTVAAQNGMVVNSISAASQAGKSATTFSVVQMDMQLQGSYASFQEFVKSAEKILRIFDITKMAITTGGEDGIPIFNISGKVYYSQ
ncbi:MAG: hypothetical protein WD712_01495 [Candidatus Spechtbacterales bacterium]